jgi:hypothetical protein
VRAPRTTTHSRQLPRATSRPPPPPRLTPSPPPSHCSAADTDKNGELSSEEYSHFMAQSTDPARRAAMHADASADTHKLFAELDSDKSGALSPSEFSSHHDFDGDGHVTHSDFSEALAHGGASRSRGTASDPSVPPQEHGGLEERANAAGEAEEFARRLAAEPFFKGEFEARVKVITDQLAADSAAAAAARAAEHAAVVKGLQGNLTELTRELSVVHEEARAAEEARKACVLGAVWGAAFQQRTGCRTGPHDTTDPPHTHTHTHTRTQHCAAASTRRWRALCKRWPRWRGA